MSTFIKKLATLTSIALFSTSLLAAPPWADEDEDELETQVENYNESTPATMDDTPSTTEAVDDAVELSPIADAVESGEPIATKSTPEAQAPAPTATVVTRQSGDVMQMPVATPAPVRLLDFPRRGMTTNKVENELGRPSEIIPAIGQPPISRWVYDDRIVYFEFSSVIHVVAK